MHCIALGNARSDAAFALIDAGADVNQQNVKGRTPLMVSVIAGCPLPVVAKLLEQGADPSVKNYQRKTVMDYAAQKRSPPLESLLVDSMKACQIAEVSVHK